MNGYYSDPEFESWPRTINKSKWGKYLGRELFNEEDDMIDEYRSEKLMNTKLKEFYKGLDDDFYVPWLSECDGNCLFESLGFYKVGKSVESLRKGISHLMYQFRNVKNVFPNVESSMKELYEEFYEKRYVKYEDEYYMYNFEVMCQDIATDGNFTRLPSQILLQFISLIYNIQIVIVPDSGGEYTCIDCTKDDEVVTAYLGLLTGNDKRQHYIPLSLKSEDKDSDDESDDESVKKRFSDKFYRDSRSVFIKWAKAMEKWVNKKRKDNYYDKMTSDLKKISNLNFV